MDVLLVFSGYNIKSLPEESLFLFKQRIVLHISQDFLEKYNASQTIDKIKFIQRDNSLSKIEVSLRNVKYTTNIEGKLDELKAVIVEDINKLLHEPIELSKLNLNIENSPQSSTDRDDETSSENSKAKKDKSNADNEFDFESLARQYSAKESLWKFEQIILPQSVLKELNLALDRLKHEHKIFDEWGLRSIEPFAKSAMNFFGQPGTGKTMAAHALANKLGKKILVASYAQIESKYHGEGPKNVEAIFLAAQRDDAILFIDEADSLLSKRLLNVTQGSEQAINSMRSQLLICLEKFTGIVIFATNLVKNYDYAFETRVKSVWFPMPDLECRQKIWKAHLLGDGRKLIKIPLAPDVNIDELAEKFDDFCGRDIKNAVIDACVDSQIKEQPDVTQANLIEACNSVIVSREKLREAKDDTTKASDTVKSNPALKNSLESTIQEHMSKEKNENWEANSEVAPSKE